MRLLFECTYVFDHPQMNSGIQRVVRNVVAQLAQSRYPAECIPVIFKNNHLYRVTKLHAQNTAWLPVIRSWLEQTLHRFWRLHAKIEGHPPFSRSSLLRKALFVAAKLLAPCILLPLLATKKVTRHAVDLKRAQPLEHRSDDVLVLLDSSWHADFFALAERLKHDGVQIVAVIYDLIPVTHPQFCDAGLVKVFDRWIEWIAHTADGFMAISCTISGQVQDQITSQLGMESASGRWYDYFYLGSELDRIHAEDRIRRKVSKAFEDAAPIYLMVSTIEPRKNHHYLIDAFERLWAQDANVRLCFVGRVGWKCTTIIERIETHAEFGSRLLMYNDLTDAELEYCYQHARSLVFPSFVEGFGLPLIEAMQRGLPAMASDIPVFREIGGDFVAYFDLLDPATLAALVAAHETSGKFPARRPVDDWQWLSWGDATAMLITRVSAHAGQQRSPDPTLIGRSSPRASYP